MDNPRTEYSTLVDLERLLNDAKASNTLEFGVNLALVIIKDRKDELFKHNNV